MSMGIHISLVILVGDTQTTGILVSLWHRQRIIPEPRVPSRGSQAQGTRLTGVKPWSNENASASFDHQLALTCELFELVQTSSQVFLNLRALTIRLIKMCKFKQVFKWLEAPNHKHEKQEARFNHFSRPTKGPCDLFSLVFFFYIYIHKKIL
jgi:hypothetical protein